jgi:hypothetical protein
MRRAVHFVGFRGEEYRAAIRAFGPPDFIHRRWDLRARREIQPDDLVVFAKGDENQEPSRISGDDLTEKMP